jgi:hypothetical protein
MQKRECSELVHKRLWRLAEEETLFLIRSYKLSPQEVFRQYTGTHRPQAEMRDAVDAVYSFNLNQANRNGFLPY